jgi:hypothetical protein
MPWIDPSGAKRRKIQLNLSLVAIGATFLLFSGIMSSIESVNLQRVCAFLGPIGFVMLLVGCALLLLEYEAWLERRKVAMCPINKNEYVATLEALRRRAELDPRDPIDTEALNRLLCIVEAVSQAPGTPKVPQPEEV